MRESCPNCGVSWLEHKSIYQTFIDDKYSEEDAKAAALLYGASKENGKRFSTDVVRFAKDKPFGDSTWTDEKCIKCFTVFERIVDKD